MKKLIYSVLLSFFMFFPISVFAEGYINVSTNSLTIEQGSSAKFTITAYNAIGDASISSGDSNIAKVNTDEWTTGMVEDNQTKSGTVDVTGVNIGTTTITIKIDAATFDEEDLSGQTKTITVNVVAKSEEVPPSIPVTPDNNNNNSNSNNTTNNNNSSVNNNKNVNNNTITDNLSKNNNLKELTVEGYELIKVDDNNYTLTVSNDITSINIAATAEDEKSNISGVGTHELNIGENNIEIVITSESGDQNKINIKVIRKDGYYLEDLESVLKKDEIKDINVIINENTEISKDDLSKIKDSGKTVKFNYYDENKKLIYSWIIDGKKIRKIDDSFLTSISFTSEYKKEIYKLSNYADGLYISFKHNGDFPDGSKVKLYIGDKYSDGDVVKVYYYDKKNVELIHNNLKVSDGYIEFEIEHSSDCFITPSNINNIVEDKTTNINTIVIVGIIGLIVLIIISIVYIIKRKNKKRWMII